MKRSGFTWVRFLKHVEISAGSQVRSWKTDETALLKNDLVLYLLSNRWVDLVERAER